MPDLRICPLKSTFATDPQWAYLYRAVDKEGQTVDFLLTAERDQDAAWRFLSRAIRRHGVPEMSTIDGSEAHAAAIRTDNQAHGPPIAIRQVTYLNHIIAQDHRAVKRITRPLLGCKPFEAATYTPAGVDLMHRLKKGQLVVEEGAEGFTPVEQFYALAA